MRDFQQPERARERAGPEVGADSVREHGDLVQDRDAEKVVHLGRFQELRLVHQQARHGLGVDMLQQGIGIVPMGVGGEHVPDRSPGGDHEVHRAGHAKPGHDVGVALGVDVGFGQQNPLAPFLIVERGLEQAGRLAGVHGAVAEVELGQGGPFERVAPRF